MELKQFHVDIVLTMMCSVIDALIIKQLVLFPGSCSVSSVNTNKMEVSEALLKEAETEFIQLTSSALAEIEREMLEAMKVYTADELIAKLTRQKESVKYDSSMVMRIQTTINYVRFVDDNAQLMKKATAQLEIDKDFMFTTKQFKRWKKSNNISNEDEVLIYKENGPEVMLLRLTQLWDYIIDTVKWNMQQIPQPNFLGALEYIVSLNDRIQAVRSMQKELLEIARSITLKVKCYRELTRLPYFPVNAADVMIDVYNQAAKDDFNEVRTYLYCFSVIGSYTDFYKLHRAVERRYPLYEHNSGKRALWKGVLDIIVKSFTCHVATLIPKSRAIAEQLLRDFDSYLRTNVHRMPSSSAAAPVPPSCVTRLPPSKRNRWAKHRDIHKQVAQVVVNFEKMMQSHTMSALMNSVMSGANVPSAAPGLGSAANPSFSPPHSPELSEDSPELPTMREIRRTLREMKIPDSLDDIPALTHDAHDESSRQSPSIENEEHDDKDGAESESKL